MSTVSEVEGFVAFARQGNSTVPNAHLSVGRLNRLSAVPALAERTRAEHTRAAQEEFGGGFKAEDSIVERKTGGC